MPVGIGSPGPTGSIVYASDMEAYASGWSLQAGAFALAAGADLDSVVGGVQIPPGVSLTYGIPAAGPCPVLCDPRLFESEYTR
jgi:hypothetical protein